MRYEVNSIENYINASGCNDEDLFFDLLLDELAKIVRDKKSELIAVIKKSNIKISEKPENKELIDILISDLSKNKRLRFEIMNMIREVHTKTGALRAEGNGKSDNKESQLWQSREIQQTIVDGLKTLFDKEGNKKILQDKVDLIQENTKSAEQKPKLKLSIGRILVVSTVSILAIFGVIHLYQKYVSKSESTGAMQPVQSSQPVQPTQTITA